LCGQSRVNKARREVQRDGLCGRILSRSATLEEVE
jgi:hypothetical protein